MQTIRSIRALQQWRRRNSSITSPVGFIPTMGALHAGHLDLIRRARQSCESLVVSIFVNPLQFGPQEDLTRYPRSLKKDLQLCRDNHVDVVFLPDQAGLYPSGFQTTITMSKLMNRWEGEHRPIHLQGVATVVTKLLNLVCPEKAYFGQKDYQQYLVIDRLVKDLNLETTIVLCPTIREPNGLAWSSRNLYLGSKERESAAILFQALNEARKAIKKGDQSLNTILKESCKLIFNQSTAKIDYFALCNANTLEPVKKPSGPLVILGAIRLANVRLIDNVLFRVSR